MIPPFAGHSLRCMASSAVAEATHGARHRICGAHGSSRGQGVGCYLHDASVTCLVVSTFFISLILSPVSCFCPGSACGCRRLMGSDKSCGAAAAFAAWPDPSSQRRDLAPGGWCLGRPEPSISVPAQTAALAFSATKDVPLASILCNTTASLRASASPALRIPARFASRAVEAGSKALDLSGIAVSPS
jgi:hypothetical protein